MAVPEEMYENIEKMIALSHEQVDTLRKLARALRLADLMGVPPAELKGRVSTRVIRDNGGVFRRWRTATLVVRHEDQEHIFPLVDVHLDLWPEDMRAAYERHTAAVDKARRIRAEMRGDK